LQEGVIDPAAAKRAQAAGLLVVMDRCWLKERAKIAVWRSCFVNDYLTMTRVQWMKTLSEWARQQKSREEQ